MHFLNHGFEQGLVFSIIGEYAGLDDFNYENYSTWEVYQQWQDDFVAANSDLVSKTAYGQSYEKRELNYMKLGKGLTSIITPVHTFI